MTTMKLVSALAMTLALSGAGAALAQDTAKAATPEGSRAEMAAKMWAAFDADGNGIVTKDELQAAARARFDKADTDGDGFLSLEEMRAAATARAAEAGARGARGMAGRDGMRERMVARMLDRMDDNGDGKLSPDEMRVARADEGFIKRFDTDKDGSVTKAEFDTTRAKAQSDRKAKRDKQMKRKQADRKKADRKRGDRKHMDGQHHGHWFMDHDSRDSARHERHGR